jgi:hypothetical protein
VVVRIVCISATAILEVPWQRGRKMKRSFMALKLEEAAEE